MLDGGNDGEVDKPVLTRLKLQDIIIQLLSGGGLGEDGEREKKEFMENKEEEDDEEKEKEN